MNSERGEKLGKDCCEKRAEYAGKMGGGKCVKNRTKMGEKWMKNKS